MPLSVGPHFFTVAIDQVIRHGVRYLFVDCPALYDRPGIYNERNVDYRDNHIRFALLNQAAIGIARYIFRPDVFHAHDWQAGLLAPYLRSTFAGDPTFFGSKCVLTIHNLGYQGNFWAVRMQEVGLDPVLYHTEGLEFNGMISFLKAGVVFSDAVTTVSPTYAREIQTPEYGFGFDGLLRSRNYKLRGILNGVDYAEWSPETDPPSARPFFRRRPQRQSRLQAPTAGRDGPSLRSGPPSDRHRLPVRRPERDRPGGRNRRSPCRAECCTCRARFGRPPIRGHVPPFQLAEARQVRSADRLRRRPGSSDRSGCDMFLMPSRYEPCGLNQIYSLRYGTVPIVRATGGLDDTVDGTTGFKFSDYSPACLGGGDRRGACTLSSSAMPGRSGCGAGWPRISRGRHRRPNTRGCTPSLHLNSGFLAS